jgi:RNA polymerase sigma factor (sigma-70 family)
MGTQRIASPDLAAVFQGESVLALSDWQLLERYRERRDELAFEAIVSRHGPMILAVCRRMLADPTDVEDAFQATFLVLVRRIGDLGPGDAIGPWLYGVAIRVANRARVQASRRRRTLGIEQVDPHARVSHPGENLETVRILDDELSRLPWKYRAPLVLCYLQSNSHDQAARQLNWPIGTVKGRLARARDLLRGRLVRRGLAPGAVAITLASAGSASGEFCRPLLERTVRSAIKLSVGESLARITSISIVSLVEGVLSAMFINQLKWVAAAGLAATVAFTGVGVLARQPRADRQETKNEQSPAREQTDDPPKRDVDRASDEPHEARVESTRDVKATPGDLLKSARTAFQMLSDRHQSGEERSVEKLYETSKRWMDAQKGAARTTEEEIAAVADHHRRLMEIVRSTNGGNRYATPSDAAMMNLYLAESALWLAEARSAKASEPQSAEKGSTAGAGKDPQSRRILAKLEEPIAMNFPRETQLSDVLKYIKSSTQSSVMPKGIPIYVDPIGLQEAEKTLESTIQAVELEGVPLRRTLQLALKQLDLIYYVDDGMLYITSANSEDFNPTLEPTPLMKMQKKADRGELSKTELNDLKDMLETLEAIRKIGQIDKARQ